MKDAFLEWAGHVAIAMLVGLLVWLYLELTPNQLSAEADLHEAALEEAGFDYRPCY